MVNVIETVTYLEEGEHGQLRQVEAPTISHSRFAFDREDSCQDKLEEEAIGRARRQAENLTEEEVEDMVPAQAGMLAEGFFPYFMVETLGGKWVNF